MKDLGHLPLPLRSLNTLGCRGITQATISPGGSGPVLLYWTDPEDQTWKPLPNSPQITCRSIFPAGRGQSVPSNKIVWVTIVDGFPTALPLEC